MTDVARGSEEQPWVVLVVEDEAPNRALLRAVLSRSNDEALRRAVVLEAGNLAAARTILSERRADLVLLDVRLPDGSGLDLAGELRAAPPEHRPRVVILSASVLPIDRDAALRSGIDAFLGKPYRPSDLVGTLQAVLAGDSPNPDAASADDAASAAEG
jgi:CheY-like chemotaxis protein